MNINELFELHQGNGLELINMTSSNDSEINFISRTAQNNGVVANVDKYEEVKPFEAGLITVALGGSVLSSFVQLKTFYTAFHVMVLKPKIEMSLNEKLFYCMCIQNNAYRYSYGRQANKTLKDIELPDAFPDWVNKTVINPISTANKTRQPIINHFGWGEFKLSDLFVFKKGKRLTKEDMFEGKLNFIGAISYNNGIRQHIDSPALYDPNCITVNYNGSVGEAFYQSEPFWASDDVNVLYPNGWKLNKFIALFIITVIKANRYRFSYGRKWTLNKMKETIIKLPITYDKHIDWEYMENYIMSLPYGDRI